MGTFWWKANRISLRDFSIVTYIDYSEIPPRDSKQKGNSKVVEEDIPKFWEELFWAHIKVKSSDIRDFLAAKMVTTKEWILHLIILLIVDGIILSTFRTSLNPQEHVRMVVDVSQFVLHRWGRESFFLTISCIKGREIEKCVQESVQFQGFSHTLQLVILG